MRTNATDGCSYCRCERDATNRRSNNPPPITNLVLRSHPCFDFVSVSTDGSSVQRRETKTKELYERVSKRTENQNKRKTERGFRYQDSFTEIIHSTTYLMALYHHHQRNRTGRAPSRKYSSSRSLSYCRVSFRFLPANKIMAECT